VNTVQEMLRYVENGVANTPTLMQVRSMIGDDRLRVLCIKLLGWMKSQHRIGKLRPLQLKAEHEWAQNLRCVTSEKLWSEVFELSGDELGFCATLTVEQRFDLCAAVDREYQPTLMI
jgi:hypothetical protein